MSTGAFALLNEQIAAINGHTIAGTTMFLLGITLLLPQMAIEAIRKIKTKIARFAGQE
jgi:putative lipase involved disintegration of autophagic bodies